MSAWAQAAYIIDEINNSMNLNNRVFEIEHRIYVFSTPNTPWNNSWTSEQQKTNWKPDATTWGEYEFSVDSVWFVLQQVGTTDSYQVVGFSLYTVPQSGDPYWTKSLPFNVDLSTFNASQANFEFDSTVINSKYEGNQESIDEWSGVDDLSEALNKILQHLGESSFTGNLASTAEAGIVKIGNNINIDASDGTISVPEGNATTAGVVIVASAIPTSNPSSTSVPSVKAVREALSANTLKSTTVNVSSGSLNGGAAPGITFNNKSLYYATYNIGTGFGTYPTVFHATLTPTADNQRGFNCIKGVTYDDSTGNLKLFSFTNSFPSSFVLGVKS